MNKFFRRIPSPILGILGAFALIFVMAMAQQVDAKPLLKAKAGQVEFLQDFDANTWFIKFGPIVQDMDESFDDIKVVWSGLYQGRPIVLIAGQQGSMCEQTYRLYWFRPDGSVALAKDFGTCFAKKVTVAVNSGMINITFDGKTKRVPLM